MTTTWSGVEKRDYGDEVVVFQYIDSTIDDQFEEIAHPVDGKYISVCELYGDVNVRVTAYAGATALTFTRKVYDCMLDLDERGMLEEQVPQPCFRMSVLAERQPA